MTLTILRSVLACVAVFTSVPQPEAQATPDHATVVFFTPGGHWRGTVSQLKTSLFGKGDIASMGAVFDSKTRLASLSHSRYVAMQTAVGPHTFSANLTGNHPKATEIVTLDLKAGSVTYLAITTTIMNYGLGVYSKLTSHIDVATCEEFQAENMQSHLEEVPEKHIVESVRPRVVELRDLPPCL